MTIARLIQFVKSAATPTWVTGPIFDKELRVSSRRRRNYVLRFAYLALLTLLLALVWISFVRFTRYRGMAYAVSRMPEAGKALTATIVWFQFGAAMLLAIVMLSTAISDEIYHKTLGVLMTTPINSFQIVMGKLFSKLLQLLVLLAISLPLLAVVRLLGGVEWGFVVSALCITLTAIIFMGSLSMFFSIHNRRAYVVILKTLFAAGILYALLPWLIFAAFENSLRGKEEAEFIFGLLHANPFGALGIRTGQMLEPRFQAQTPFFSWSLHCLIMLGASAAVLALCVRRVRKVALRQATGEAGLFVSRRRARAAAKAAKLGAVPEETKGRIRRIHGAPVLWKELRAPLAKNRLKALLFTGAFSLIVLTTYAICESDNVLDHNDVQMAYLLIFLAIGALGTMVISATSITSEKESRCWPILLAAPLEDWHIVLGKAVGIFRRTLPFWLPLFVHLFIFTMVVRYIHPIAILQLGMLAVYLVLFLTCTGLYFSSRFKRTTTAVVMNIALPALLWAVIPGLVGLYLVGRGMNSQPEFEGYGAIFLSPNPGAQGAIIADATCGEWRARKDISQISYDWPDRGMFYFPKGEIARDTTWRMFAYMVLYIGVGLLFAWTAKSRLRRSVF